MAGAALAVDEPGSARYCSKVSASDSTSLAGNEVVPRKWLFRPYGERAFLFQMRPDKRGFVNGDDVDAVNGIVGAMSPAQDVPLLGHGYESKIQQGE